MNNGIKIPDTRKCIGCGESFPFRWYKSFCSEKCRLTHSDYSGKQKRILKCKTCGKEFQGKFARVYCSKKCSSKFFRNKARAKRQIREIGQIIGGSKQY